MQKFSSKRYNYRLQLIFNNKTHIDKYYDKKNDINYHSYSPFVES